MRSVLEEIGDLVEKALAPKQINFRCHCCDDVDEDDFDDDEDEDEFDYEPCEREEPNGEMRFGYGLEVDEPRASDYCSRKEFLDDHAAFDRFVDAGEECVARGLDKRNDAPIHKCNAIRKSPFDTPPIGIDLIGETDFWGQKFCW